MSIQNRIGKLKDYHKLDPVKNIVLLMKYFNWTLEDVKQLSIPAYITLVATINEIEKEAKEKSKPSKKHGNR